MLTIAEKYNSRTARAHIKRVIDLLENPYVLSNHSQIRKKQVRSRSHSQSSADGKEGEMEFEKEIRELIIKKNQEYQELV